MNFPICNNREVVALNEKLKPMKNFTLSLLFLFFFFAGHSQDSTMVLSIERLRSLDHDIQELKDYVKDQRTSQAMTEKQLYDRNYNRLLSMAELLRELQATIDLIESDREQVGVYNKISQANNPSSDILGFKLTDIIKTSFEETLNERSISVDKVLPLKNVVNNLIHGLGAAFPPLQLMSSVVAGISAYTDKSYIAEAVQSNKRVRFANDIALKGYTSTLDTVFIGSFTRKLAPYINFYIELNKINTGFDEDLSKFSFFYSDISQNISTMVADFERNTTISLSGNITLQINRLMNFNQSGTDRFNHAEFNRKPEVTYVTRTLEPTYEFVKLFNEYARQYLFLTNRNIENNKAQLESAKKLPNSNVAAIDLLISEISLKQVGTEAIPGFVNKYNRNISSITSKIQDLRTQ